MQHFEEFMFVPYAINSMKDFADNYPEVPQLKQFLVKVLGDRKKHRDNLDLMQGLEFDSPQEREEYQAPWLTLFRETIYANRKMVNAGDRKIFCMDNDWCDCMCYKQIIAATNAGELDATYEYLFERLKSGCLLVEFIDKVPRAALDAMNQRKDKITDLETITQTMKDLYAIEGAPDMQETMHDISLAVKEMHKHPLTPLIFILDSMDEKKKDNILLMMDLFARVVEKKSGDAVLGMATQYLGLDPSDPKNMHSLAKQLQKLTIAHESKIRTGEFINDISVDMIQGLARKITDEPDGKAQDDSKEAPKPQDKPRNKSQDKSKDKSKPSKSKQVASYMSIFDD